MEAEYARRNGTERLWAGIAEKPRGGGEIVCMSVRVRVVGKLKGSLTAGEFVCVWVDDGGSFGLLGFGPFGFV